MPATNEEIINRLKTAGTLDGLELECREGRFVVEGFKTPKTHKGREFGLSKWNVHQIAGRLHVEGVHVRDIHFQNCDLSSLSFFNCAVSNCVFENSRCRNIGFWESRIEKCFFIGCNLREAVLGGIDIERPNKPNRYTRVFFGDCDLRNTIYYCESYNSCEFHQCRIESIDFLGAIFEDCKFDSRVEDVIFRSHYPGASRTPGNRLLRCDFRTAEIIDCRFLGINIDPELFPKDDDVIILPKGPADLKEWQRKLPKENYYISAHMKETGTPGILSRRSLRQMFSEDEIGWLDAIVKKNQ